MKDGSYIYYKIQHRTTHENEWLKPDSPLKPVTEEHYWASSSFDWMGFVANPLTKRGGYSPRYKKSDEQIRAVYSKTGSRGWWDLKHALKAVQRLQKADSEGKFDHKDTYQNHCQEARHEFRIMKMTVSQKTEVIGIEEAIASA